MKTWSTIRSIARRPAVRRELLAVCVALVIWLAGAALALRRDHAVLPMLDLIPEKTHAYELVEEGKIPRHGCLSSYGGWNTPGITFALAPGAWLFPENPYLGERIAALSLFALTLGGIWAVFRRFDSVLPFVAAAALFGCSVDGQFYAYSLWPRGHPVFAFWFLAFTLSWAADRKGWGLAAALLVWALGMYWFMEIAFLVLVIPVVWLLYRPPVSWRALALAIAAGTVVWSPFLLFQVERDGVDLVRNLIEQHPAGSKRETQRSQIQNPELAMLEGRPKGWVPDWDFSPPGDASSMDPNPGHYFEDPVFGTIWSKLAKKSVFGGTGYYFNLLEAKKGWVFQRLEDGALFAETESGWGLTDPVAHFLHTGEPIPEVEPLASSDFNMLLQRAVLRIFPANTMAWGALVVGLTVTLGAFRSLKALQRLASGGRSRRAVLALSTVGVLVSTWIIAQSPQLGLVALGASVGALLSPWLARPRSEDGATAAAPVLGVVLLSAYLIPLVTTIASIEPAQWEFYGRRFYWISPLLIGALVGVWWTLLQPRLWSRVGFVALSAMALWMTAERGEFWPKFSMTAQRGFQTLPPHPAYAVLDYLAEEIETSGQTDVSIGYDISFPRWVLAHRAYTDGAYYKVGMELDFVLRYQHGIENQNQLPEGIAFDDDYRIVEIDNPQKHQTYFDLSAYPRMTVVKQWEHYALLARIKEVEAD